MEYAHQLSNLIYDYLLNRFKFGYYQYGDSLPTVDVFCRQFNVSVHPIWAALRRLRADGYIDMKNGRVTRVIYELTERERRNFIIDYFSRRWSAYLDLYQATELIYIPFLVEGFRRMNEQDLAYVTQLAECTDIEDIILFYSFALQKIGNPLLMNLFWETSLFLGYPFAKGGFRPYDYNTNIGCRQLKLLVHHVKEGFWTGTRDALVQHYRSVTENLIVNMGPYIRTVPKEDQLSFVWRIYNGHPQVCYDLVYRLLSEIYMEEYRNTKYLPSYERMAKKYGVSVSTVRRAISMTNQIGATRSENGKGIHILEISEAPSQPDFTNPVIRRNLSYLVQALELLLHTCQGVSLHFYRNLLPEEREELIARFEENQRTGRGRLSIHTYLFYIAKYSRIQAIRQIYGTIYGLFLWGYPLNVSGEAEVEMRRQGADFTASMIRCMRQNDVEQCAITIEGYVAELLPYGVKSLKKHCIGTGEQSNVSAIRLLIADE